ncbi:rhomboid family intramembrane serine protease [Arenicella chitinivorans]|uniref:Rhomboid family intramembrane serine protease n=1 Tax=Arenicella chitinivorans TaxID=1329800 RepID=A0A918S0P8_9GAMM|nr:rhomboid family intramembrane serine protease [Arenicella chitinivorans]GHA18361.1 rhomboid family intramembrane serine protease [Arenicella chitinivorans]
MPSISQILQSMTNRLVIITVLVYFVQTTVFAGRFTGGELFGWQSPNFELWQLLTHVFLHGSEMHLLFNMIALWSFGRVLERVWGNRRFLLFYLICGVGAAVISMLVNNLILNTQFTGHMVGASGAIYGILVAFALLFPNFKIMLIFLPVPIAAKYFVPVLLLIDLTAGFTGVSIFGQNIAHFAHVGGAIVGAVLVFLWSAQSTRK